MDDQHGRLIRRKLLDKKVILSFFEKRYELGSVKHDDIMLNYANYIVTDSKVNTNKIEDYLGKKLRNVVDITPYDTRKDMGISQHLTVQKVLVPIDDIKQEDLENAVVKFAEYCEENKNARIYMLTRKAEYNKPQLIINNVKDILERNGYDPELATVEESNTSETRMDEFGKVQPKFFAVQCVDELSVSKCIREQRLIVDLRESAKLYSQISGLTFGIPQIVRSETQYVQHNENGYVLENVDDLPKILDYYLGRLENWNRAQVKSFEIGESYTTKKLIAQWKEVIKFIDEN